MRLHYILYTSLCTLEVLNTLYNIKQAYFVEIQYGYIVNFTVEESKKAKMNAQDIISKKVFNETICLQNNREVTDHTI